MTEMSVDIHRVINSNIYKKVGCARKAGIGRKFCVIVFLVFELVPTVYMYLRIKINRIHYSSVVLSRA